jgi:hypothetical protein
MRKFCIAFLSLLSIHVMAANINVECFIGADGKVYFLRPASSDDIDNPSLKVSEGIKKDRKWRAQNNYFGVFVIEDENHLAIRTLMTGRMPLAVQPWESNTTTEGDPRLEVIAQCYEWILDCHSLAHTRNIVQRGNDDHKVLLVCNNNHAATAVVPEDEPFNTTAVVDALARLASRIGHKVAPDSTISLAGKPCVIISIGKKKPKLCNASQSQIYELPYYEGKEGMRYTTVTSMTDCQLLPELPKEISGLLKELNN